MRKDINGLSIYSILTIFNNNYKGEINVNIAAIRSINILIKDIQTTKPLWATDELKKRGDLLVMRGEGIKQRMISGGKGLRTRGYTDFRRNTFKFMLDINLHTFSSEKDKVKL